MVDGVDQFAQRRFRRCVIVSVVVDTLNGNADPRRAAHEAQAEYYRLELGGIRARAESDLARRYIELQQVQDSGYLSRVADVRRMIRALEHEIVTLERLGIGLNCWL